MSSITKKRKLNEVGVELSKARPSSASKKPVRTRDFHITQPPKKKSRPSPSPSPSLSVEDNKDDQNTPEEDENSSSDVAIAKTEENVKTFADLGIIEPLCDACSNLGWKTPSPIQVESIPLALQGRDMIGIAVTGSGKTAAFALPVLQALMENPQKLFGLVLAPTRELAYQTSQQFSALGSLISVRTAVIVGGMDMVSQAIALAKNPHIIVATPGRLLDHLENTKGFSLRHLKYLVIDEADRLLDMDFGPIIDKILKVLPREGRKTYLFSATMGSKVESLQRASLQNPVRVSVESKDPHALALASNGEAGTAKYQTVATLLQSYLFVPHKHKDLYLVSLLSGPFTGRSTILFARTVREVQRVTLLLRALGLGAIPMHGQMSQSSRLSALNKFKAGSRDILVATDVAARGLDIASVDLVLNFDLPQSSASYVHRVGRTARAGKSGHAITIVTQYDVEVWLRIEKFLGKKLEEYKGVVKEEVLILAEEVGEAQRMAVRQLKDELAKKDKKDGSGKRGKRKGRDAMDRDEG